MSSLPRISVLFGTRPEAIKLGPVVPALQAAGFEVEAVTTGQHRELVTNVLPLFGITAADDLELMRPGQSLDYLLGSGIQRVGAYLERTQPVAVVVQGDTVSALAAALAAFHHRVPVAHVEAGLRTHDMSLPFPEEMNRRVVSVLAQWHFPPTQHAADNLAREGIVDHVVVTGNTVVDALRSILESAPSLPPALAGFVTGHRYVVATAHRRESWGDGIRRVAQGVKLMVDRNPALRAVFVCHPNPQARQPVVDVLGGHERVLILDAIAYPEFLVLLGGAALAVSDSGGVQEEGPTLGIPVVVTRAVTERPEGLLAGVVRLAGTDVERIAGDAQELLADPEARIRTIAAGSDLYGDGHAAERIAATLAEAIKA